MNVESDDIQTKVTDNRGRIDLGTEYANKHVTIAVVNVENDIPVDDELAAAYRDATVSARHITHESSQRRTNHGIRSVLHLGSKGTTRTRMRDEERKIRRGDIVYRGS